MKSKDCKTPPRGKKHRQKFGLTKPADVRRMLASIINQVIVDEMEIHKGKGIGYLAQILLKSMEAEFEERIIAIEGRLDRLEQGGKIGK